MSSKNWIYKLESITKQDTVALRNFIANGLYLTSIGDNFKASDLTQQDINIFNNWILNGCATFLTNEVVLYIPPKQKNFENKYRPKMALKVETTVMKLKVIDVLEVSSPFNVDVTCILTNTR